MQLEPSRMNPVTGFILVCKNSNKLLSTAIFLKLDF